MAKATLAGLNDAPTSEFAARLGGVFEHAPWIVAAAAGRRPFATVEGLFEAMRRIVEEAEPERRLALLRAHPELAGEAARRGAVTAESAAEQAGAGLSALPGDRAAEMESLNARYRATHDIPFIACVKRHGRDSLLAAMRRRVGGDTEAERATALREVLRIAALRLDALVEGPGPLPVSGRLSTHVLDSAAGLPAEGVAVELVELSADGDRVVAMAVTGANGRTAEPLVAGRPIPRATYELRFAIGDYFRDRGATLADPPFLDVVPLRFGVAEPEGHYHVPLVATPWSFSTYRGS